MKGKSSMTAVKGLYSSKSNPVKAPKKVSSQMSGSNPSAVKANAMMKQAYAEKESNRGKSGM